MKWYLTYVLKGNDEVAKNHISVYIPCETFKDVRRWWRTSEYKDHKLLNGHMEDITLTKDEEYVLHEILWKTCKRICEYNDVRHNTWDSIYTVCRIDSLTPKMEAHFRDNAPKAVEVINSLITKGFVFKFDKDGKDIPSFIPLGWNKIKEVDIKFVEPNHR